MSSASEEEMTLLLLDWLDCWRIIVIALGRLVAEGLEEGGEMGDGGASRGVDAAWWRDVDADEADDDALDDDEGAEEEAEAPVFQQGTSDAGRLRR